MNEYELSYKRLLQDQVRKGLLPQKATNDVLASVSRMSNHQCFDFIFLEMVQSNNTSNLTTQDVYNFNLLWYLNMVSFVGGGQISAYSIMKLALSDLIYAWNDKSLVPYMLDLDNGRNISRYEIASALKKSNVFMSNYIGKRIDELWTEWNSIAIDVNACMRDI